MYQIFYCIIIFERKIPPTLCVFFLIEAWWFQGALGSRVQIQYPAVSVPTMMQKKRQTQRIQRQRGKLASPGYNKTNHGHIHINALSLYYMCARNVCRCVGVGLGVQGPYSILFIAAIRGLTIGIILCTIYINRKLFRQMRYR